MEIEISDESKSLLLKNGICSYSDSMKLEFLEFDFTKRVFLGKIEIFPPLKKEFLTFLVSEKNSWLNVYGLKFFFFKKKSIRFHPFKRKQSQNTEIINFECHYKATAIKETQSEISDNNLNNMLKTSNFLRR